MFCLVYEKMEDFEYKGLEFETLYYLGFFGKKEKRRSILLLE